MKAPKIHVMEIEDNKSDGMLLFRTVNGNDGHIVLHMVDAVIVDFTTGKLTIEKFHHDYPEMIVSEITINVTGWFSIFYELTFEYLSEDRLRISCKHKEKDNG